MSQENAMMKKVGADHDVDLHSLETAEHIEKTIWKIIRTYFEDNPHALVNHHLESYNDFFEQGIFQIFREKNPITLTALFDHTIQDYRSQCRIYMGGMNGTRVYFGKPVIYDANEPHYMFPNEARLRGMTYGMTIHYDVDIEFLNILEADSVEAALNGDFVVGGGIDDASDDEDGLTKNYGGAGKEENKKVKEARKKAPVPITPSEAKDIREFLETTVTKDPKTNLVIQKRLKRIEKVFLGKFPIMVQSNFCVLRDLPKYGRFMMGECRNDPGGYFIIDGKEKVVIPQEKFGDNMLYIRKGHDLEIHKTESARASMLSRCEMGGAGITKMADNYLYMAELKSVSENVTKPVRTLSVMLLRPTTQYSFGNIVVNIPNVRKPVPLFIVFRALGILSDKDIISTILLDLDKYESMVDLFIPSVHDAGIIYTQRNAIEYIAELTKGKGFHHGLEILADYLFPHIGETNYREKALFLGNIVFRLMSVATGLELPTDRDHFKYKRLELVGNLIHQLFQEYYNLQLKTVQLNFESILNKNLGNYSKDLPRLIDDHQRDIFQTYGRILEDGFKKAFKGNWGAFSHTKRIGVIQDLNRLSFNTMISHLRKTNLPIDPSLKLVGPRLCHNSQWGYIDPVDTPDGANIGIHKNLAIMTTVSRGFSRKYMIDWLREMIAMKLVTDFLLCELANVTKIIVNGYWAGCVMNPIESVEKIRTYRRLAMIPVDTSVTFDIRLNTIFIYTDSGRLCRPIFFVEHGKENGQLSFMRSGLDIRNSSWSQLVGGFEKKKALNNTGVEITPYYTKLAQIYDGVGESMEQDPKKVQEFLRKQAIIDYIDNSESENTYIAIHPQNFIEKAMGGKNQPRENYTHCEIHGSLLLGVMGNQVTYPEMNPLARNLFSCGQSKQAVSVYHTNYSMRMDKTSVVLHYGQIPLVKTRYMDFINHEENAYGFNAIVAIACFTGYNVEDAILINEASIQRGMFRTSYFTTYSAHEEKGDPDESNTEVPIDKIFANIESLVTEGNITGMKPGYDYSHLDQFGLIKEGTPIEDKTMLIGLTATSGQSAYPEKRTDMSIGTKKGQVGYVDRTYLTEGEQGERIAKVRIREERIPAIGDKFAGRAGQKGTIGMVIPERDMPFTKHGVRPDIIINPHAIPSRMTLGQLVESLTGKACTIYGGFADCTAFGQRGQKVKYFGQLLQKALGEDGGFESHGNEVLYDGQTGEQIESSIFIGNVYYMRLKHMVKDKQQSRCLGPKSALTKQPVGGRANDGGLRIGEMERDALIAHGAAGFLNESIMERSDKYHIAVCNKSGMLALYNPVKNLFMSPMVDGPLTFTGEQSKDLMNMRLETVTRFGREFSVIEIPYTMKLLIQEMATLNVQMRVITEDNINQIESLSYTNIEHMEKMGTFMDTIVRTAKKQNSTTLSKQIEFAMMSANAEEEEDGDKDGTKKKDREEAENLDEIDVVGDDEWLLQNKDIMKKQTGGDGEKLKMKLNKDCPVEILDGYKLLDKGENRHFKVRSFVHLKGDVKSDRLWMISNIYKSPNDTILYTLITNDYDGLKPIDQIQIVKETRLIEVNMEGGASAHSTERQAPIANAQLQGEYRPPELGNAISGAGLPNLNQTGGGQMAPMMPMMMPMMPSMMMPIMATHSPMMEGGYSLPPMRESDDIPIKIPFETRETSKKNSEVNKKESGGLLVKAAHAVEGVVDKVFKVIKK